MTSQSTPEGGAMSFAYTDFDAVLKRTDARNVETHYHYDALNRPNQVWYTGVGGSDDPNASRPALPTGVAATSDVIIAYNTAAPGNGAVNRIDDGGGFETYVYDSLGRNTSKTRTIDGVNSYQTQYQYNQANQLALMIYPSGKRVRMNFDSRGRMIGEDKVDTTGNVLTSYLSGIGYNVAGQVTSMTSGSGVVESYTYSSNRLQLTRQTAVKGATTLMDLNYSYAAAAGASGAGTTAGNSGQLMAIGSNPSGQPSSINGQNRTQSFSYDDLGRLVSASSWGISQRSYSYDRWGNRTGMSDSITGASQNVSLQLSSGAPTNRITSVINNGVNSSYVYDGAGNLISDGAHNYQYDGEGRIASIDGGAASYSYDSVNRRVKKVTTDGSTYYLWEADKVIAEYSTVPPQAVGGLKYYLADKLSTRLTTNGSGNVLGTQDHLPFGEEGGFSGQGERHRFTSYDRDGESASDYAINREYSFSSGRFNRPDPFNGSSDLNNPQLFNRYSDAGNDPINFVDPLGLARSFCFGFHVFILSVDRATGNVISSRYAGFLATFCVSIDFNREIDEALRKLGDLTQKKKCREFLERLAYNAFLKYANTKPGSLDEEKAVRDLTSADQLTKNLESATRVIKGDTPNENRAETVYGPQNSTITFYRDFFEQSRRKDIIVNDEPKIEWTGRTPAERAESLIHEGLHTLFRGASDALLGEIISGKAITGSADERRKKGSELINREIAKSCDGK